MLPPIKIHIAGRDKYMRQQYETQQAKVERKDGTIAIIDRKDILPTDKVIEYLSNDYIKPLRIKLFDIDIVYAILMKLVLIFNYANSIKEKFTLVHQYGRPRHRLITIGRIYQTLSKNWTEPISSVKFIDRVVLALDIFKVEGLKIAIRFNEKVSGLQVYYNTILSRLQVKIKIRDVTQVIYGKIIEKLKTRIKIDKPVMLYYAILEEIDYAKIKDIADKTIEDISDKTIEELTHSKVAHFYFRCIADFIIGIVQNFKNLFKTKAEIDSFLNYYAKPVNKILQKGLVDAVVYTYTIVDEINDETIGSISNKTIEDITVKYS